MGNQYNNFVKQKIFYTEHVIVYLLIAMSKHHFLIYIFEYLFHQITGFRNDDKNMMIEIS